MHLLSVQSPIFFCVFLFPVSMFLMVLTHACCLGSVNGLDQIYNNLIMYIINWPH